MFRVVSPPPFKLVSKQKAMDQSLTLELGASASQFIDCLERSNHVTKSFDYWLLTDPLLNSTCEAVTALPIAPPATPLLNGRREGNNSTRVYFSPDVQEQFPICGEIASAFRHPRVIKAIEATTGTDLSTGQLRIEYCQDTDGFWLEPHVDIPVKLFTMLIYLSNAPELYDAGTDIYDESPEHRLVATAPYEFNTGLIFIPGKNTWHGFTPRPIRGVRKSLIVNYVSPQWQARQELC